MHNSVKSSIPLLMYSLNNQFHSRVMRWLNGRAFDSKSKGCRFDSCPRQFLTNFFLVFFLGVLCGPAEFGLPHLRTIGGSLTPDMR